MTFLILPKIQNSNLQSFDIQPKSFSQNVCAHSLIIEINICQRNILISPRKVSFSEHGLKWPITISVAGKSIWWHFFISSHVGTYLYELNHWAITRTFL